MVSLTIISHSYRYIIDSSAMISQKDNEQHRRRIYKSQWDNIDALVRNKEIVTCSEIACEVEDESIKTWMNDNELVILPIDDDIQENVKKVVKTNKNLVDFKSNKSSGDAFLIATAMKYNLTVITEESFKSNKKIPFTCKTLGINCVDILGLCERENWEF